MRKNREDMIVNINISSDKNRSHLIVFTLFLIIISLLAINITDKIIFINEPISVPYLSPIKIPLESFFIITPIFIVMFHLNFLYNLYHHKNRIMYGYQNFEIKYQEIIPSIFNFFYIFSYIKTGILIKTIANIMFFTVILVLPLSTLLFLQYKIVPYHNQNIITLYQTLIILDTILIILYKLDFFNECKISLKGIKFLKIYFLKLKSFIKKNIFLLSLISLSIFVSLSIFIVPITNEEKIPLTNIKISNHIHRNLNLQREILIKTPPSPILIAKYLELNRTQTEAINDFSKGLIVTNRDFNFINLSYAQLPNIKLNFSELKGANLRYTKIPNAELFHVNLQNSNLSNANLRNSELGESKLQNSNLINFNCKNCDLSYVNAQNCKMINAKFQNSKMDNIKLQNSNLDSAYLTNSSLQFANLTDTILTKADLKNTYLANAQLTNSDLSYASVQNTYLNSSDLTNVNLSYADLQNTLLNYTIFNRTIFKKTKMYCSDINNAKIKNILNYGIILEPTNIKDFVQFKEEAYNIKSKRRQRAILKRIQEVIDGNCMERNFGEFKQN